MNPGFNYVGIDAFVFSGQFSNFVGNSLTLFVFLVISHFVLEVQGGIKSSFQSHDYFKLV